MDEDLKAKIAELEHQLMEKENEIIGYLDRIEKLENSIMKLESVIPNVNSGGSKDKWKHAIQAKLSLQIEEKNHQMRDLKDRMGHLRQENVQLQLQLKKYTADKPDSTIIRIEEKKEPLEILVKELQDKIHMQQMIINQLKENNKEQEIESLYTQITELKEALSVKNLKLEELDKMFSEQNQEKISLLEVQKKPIKRDFISDLTEELQQKLNKAKIEIKSLQKELHKYKNSKRSIDNI